MVRNLLVVNWEEDGKEIKRFVDETGKLKSRPQNLSYYFKEGLTYSFVSSYGFSCRMMPKNCIFDVGGSSMFPMEGNPQEFSGIVSSKLVSFIMRILNPTVNYQVGDLKNIPIPAPSSFDSTTLDRQRLPYLITPISYGSTLMRARDADKPLTLSDIAKDCIVIKKELYAYHIMERDFKHDPFTWGLGWLPKRPGVPLKVKDALRAFFQRKAELEARLLINEALNDELVFKLDDLLPDEMTLTDALERFGMLAESDCEPSLAPEDEELAAVYEVLSSEGVPVGAYPVRDLSEEERLDLESTYLRHRRDRGSGNSVAISGMDFGIVEELSAKLKVSPTVVALEIARVKELPPKAVQDVISEHLQALALDIMREDDDGILSLGADTGESSLPARIVERWRALGIGDSYHELENLLGKKLDAYLLKDFFKDHTKRFMSRPILWHLASDAGNINFYVRHHGWTYDKLLLLKSKYLGEVKRTLDNTLATETDVMKRERLTERLAELDRFAHTLDELLDGSYHPKTDDGVAKNIAPLQNKGLLKHDVLSQKMVDKMLKVEW